MIWISIIQKALGGGIKQLGIRLGGNADNMKAVVSSDTRNTELLIIVGRLLATRRETAQEVLLDVTASGAYMVKIGDAPARRIVVRR